jgi:hypothetical protein
MWEEPWTEQTTHPIYPREGLRSRSFLWPHYEDHATQQGGSVPVFSQVSPEQFLSHVQTALETIRKSSWEISIEKGKWCQNRPEWDHSARDQPGVCVVLQSTNRESKTTLDQDRQGTEKFQTFDGSLWNDHPKKRA